MNTPFPYIGKKSMAADLIWARLGDMPNYVEPFCGSAAVLLARPVEHQWWDRIETLNDADGLLSNAWRSIRLDPDAVAAAADCPVSEVDIHARHLWLVNRRAEITARLQGDPDWCDPKAAGYWIWGACCWIAGGWCTGEGPWQTVDGVFTRADVGAGITRQLPHLGAGRGIHRKLPHLGDVSGEPGWHCEAWSEHLRETMRALADRLRRVRICCGDWTRVLGPTPTVKLGVTAVFLDPPYAHSERRIGCYAVETDCSGEVREWAIAHGDDPQYRICLAGYEGEHEMPEAWECVPWKAPGGYGHQGTGRGRENAGRERLWFSPHCARPDRGWGGLFAWGETATTSVTTSAQEG